MIRKTDTGKSVYLPLGEAMEFGYTIKDEAKAGAIKLRYRIFSLIGIATIVIIFYSVLKSSNNASLYTLGVQFISLPIIYIAVHLISIFIPSNVMPYLRERDGKLQFKTRSIS